jgi:hypothetical protein
MLIRIGLRGWWLRTDGDSTGGGRGTLPEGWDRLGTTLLLLASGRCRNLKLGALPVYRKLNPKGVGRSVFRRFVRAGAGGVFRLLRMRRAGELRGVSRNPIPPDEVLPGDPTGARPLATPDPYSPTNPFSPSSSRISVSNFSALASFEPGFSPATR